MSHIVAALLPKIPWRGPGAGLVRAWCGPGAGLARAWCGLQDRSRGAGLAPTEAAEPASLQDQSRGAGLALRNSHWTKAARTYVNMFEGPVTGNIPEVLDNGEVTDGTHVNRRAAGPRFDALRSSNGPGGKHCSVRQQRAIQSLDDRVTAELASKLDSSVLAPAIAPRRRPWPPRTARWPRTEAASQRCRAR